MPLVDDQGKPLVNPKTKKELTARPVIDENDIPVPDGFGNPMYERPILTSDHKPVLDEDGEPRYSLMSPNNQGELQWDPETLNQPEIATGAPQKQIQSLLCHQA